MYDIPPREAIDRRRRLATTQESAFRQFSQSVFKAGAISAKTKQLIAVAVAHVTQCPYCISGHTKAACREGATAEEIMEAIWVAAEMKAGAAYAHSLIAMEAIASDGKRERRQHLSTQWSEAAFSHFDRDQT